MKEVFAWDEELFISVLYFKSKWEKPTFGLNKFEFATIRLAFIKELKTKNIQVFFLPHFYSNYFGHMHGNRYIYDNVTLDELIQICKNSSKDEEVTNLIWDEELICKLANIDTNIKKLKLDNNKK